MTKAHGSAAHRSVRHESVAEVGCQGGLSPAGCRNVTIISSLLFQRQTTFKPFNIMLHDSRIAEASNVEVITVAEKKGMKGSMYMSPFGLLPLFPPCIYSARNRTAYIVCW